MQRIRHRRVIFVACWLTFHLAIVTAAPVTLCMRAGDRAAGMPCTCTHAADAPCPMHHAAAKGDRTCSCRSTDDGSAAVLESLLGPSAVLTSPFDLQTPSVVEFVPSFDVRVTSAFPVPDAPPPRA